MDAFTTSAKRVVAIVAAGTFGVTAPLIVSSLSQAAVQGHHASSRDSDGDKMPNRWELRNSLNPHKANAHRDADADGLQNLTEFEDGTDPQDDDSDDDGVEDGDDDSPAGECDDSDDDNDRGGAVQRDSSTQDDDCDDDASTTTSRWIVAW
jgi:hypothetical protein